MSHRRVRPLVAASLLSLILPAAASAADVSIRVEGSAATLAGPAVVSTAPGTFQKAAAGGPATCSSTSIGGALEALTGGAWTGTNSDLGMSVETILGETHVFDSGAFWSLFVNGMPASLGICQQEVGPGDRILIAPTCTGADTPACFSGGPLELVAPATAAPGAALALHTDEYTVSPDFTTATSAPSAGATITGAGQAVVTDAAGNATVRLAAASGPQVFTVTKGDRIRGTAVVCATTGADGACGPASVASGGGAPGASCATNGHDGKCGTTDRTPPFVRIAGIRDGQRFARRRAPRTLAGSVSAEPKGLRSLRLRLTRTDRGRCTTYHAGSERFVRMRRCGAARGRSFAVGTGPEFSYLLPERLGRGRYVLDVLAVDAVGNRGVLTRGRSRVVFHVR